MKEIDVTDIRADQAACQEPASLWRRSRRIMRHACKEAAWHIRVYVYCRYIYRHHMRLIHPRWHWWTKYHHIIGGPRMDVCEWCGERRVYSERVRAPDELLLKP